jgi:alpha-tubulin suppressor-like RCC1 family protein
MHRRISLAVTGATIILGAVPGLAWAHAQASVYRFGGYGGDEQTAPTAIPGMEGASVSLAGNGMNYALIEGVEYASGGNHHGQLGDETETDSTSAVRVEFPEGTPPIVEIGESDKAGYAIAEGGQGYAWGKGGSALCPGTAGKANVLTPQPVSTITDAVEVRGGAAHVLWLLASGKIVACGEGGAGQLGDGNGKVQNSPVEVENLTNVVQISAGNVTSCALTSSGQVYDWGGDEHGQIGNGTIKEGVAVPYHVNLPKPAIEVSCGGSLPENGSSCALLEGGTPYCWGDDEYGQLGNGVAVEHELLPVQATEFGTLAQIAASGQSTVGLTPEGVVEALGSKMNNALGQVRGSTHGYSLTPVFDASGALEISAVASNTDYRT